MFLYDYVQSRSKRAFIRDLRGLLSIWQDLQANIRDKAAPSCVYQEPDLIERVGDVVAPRLRLIARDDDHGGRIEFSHRDVL
jgi:ribonuclease G